MRFLVDANLPRSALGLLQGFGHVAEHVSDCGLAAASDFDIAARACGTRAALLTRDLDFADIRRYPPAHYQGLVVIRLPDDAIAKKILSLLERFLKQTELVAQLPGHIVILEKGRVRFRPALV
jgi:predicted nuclease of predicted toxin-antitoxin system